MIEPTSRTRIEGPAPRLFGLPPGPDFAREVVVGLARRLRGAPPEAWARVTIYVSTRRMQRRLAEILDEGGARLLPRLLVIEDLNADPASAGLPAPASPLRRRLELSRLVAALLAREEGLAPRARLYDLSDSLASLMEEMQGEGVPPSAVAALDVTDLSGHWSRALTFLRILEPWFEAEGPADPQARLRRIVERLARTWLTDPPQDPVIVAGATASRGIEALLMQAVARLPQGAVILPGFDIDLPDVVWGRLDSAMTAEDHPQFRYARLMGDLGLAPGDVRRWTDIPPPSASRARLVSLSLRPPPVTDQWLSEGPLLGDLGPATEGLTLLEAPSPRLEAEAIALRLRQAVEDGMTAALVTPDRNLTRAVAAALDRWGIVPDDSAGVPLGLTPPGRLLRQVARGRGSRLTGEALLALLKHPLCHAGEGRGFHLLRTHALELSLRRRGPAYPTGTTIATFAATGASRAPGRAEWAAWLVPIIEAMRRDDGEQPLAVHLREHLALTETLSVGSVNTAGASTGGALWDEAAGRAARGVCDDLALHADAAGDLSAADYASLFEGVLRGEELRERDRGHPQVLIWGTTEARVQGADLVILGGLNEGVWPAAPEADPWLNRRMRVAAGLPLPERRIGLSALDYMTALGSREAWITHSLRDAEAPMTPSRWLNRLLNLIGGLPDQGGTKALKDMRQRGAVWLAQAEALSRPECKVKAAPRPSPRPPLDARPKQLSVSRISNLLRDPYTVYAQSILGLYELDPLAPEADAGTRGTILHRVFEVFVRDDLPLCGAALDVRQARARLLATAARVLEEDCGWPVMRRFWLAQVERVADRFLQDEARRSLGAKPHLFEVKGEAHFETLGITVTAKADRIDMTSDGRVVILDYKTGTPPSEKAQAALDKQLLIEAAMAERGAFGALGIVRVESAAYLGLGSDPKVVRAPLDDLPPDRIWTELEALLTAWADPARGYSARLAPRSDEWTGGHDHLARYGEWDHSTPVTPEDVG